MMRHRRFGMRHPKAFVNADVNKKQQEEDEGKVRGVGETKKAHGQATQKKVTKSICFSFSLFLNAQLLYKTFLR